MARWLRSPAVLMAAYAGISLYAGPWLGTGRAPHRSIVLVLAVVVLAGMVSQGSRAARVVLMFYSAAGVVIVLFGSASSWPAAQPAPRLGGLACYLAQICLLASEPVYQRTRPGWVPGRRPAGGFLPAPRPRAVLASAAAGLVITVLPAAGLRPVACPPGHGPDGRGPCLAQGTGYPVAYRFTGGIAQIHSGTFHWLFAAAPHGVPVLAFAADWALWSLSILLVPYLARLNIHREYRAVAPQPPGEPAGP